MFCEEFVEKLSPEALQESLLIVFKRISDKKPSWHMGSSHMHFVAYTTLVHTVSESAQSLETHPV